MTLTPKDDPIRPLKKCAGCGISIFFSSVYDRWVVHDPWGIPVEFYELCPSDTHEYHWPPEETQ